jgi:acetyl esterase/lipase
MRSIRTKLVLSLAVTAFLTTAVLAAAPGRPRAGRGYPPAIEADAVEVYKTVGDVELRIWIFKPEGHKPEDKRPAIVFFFGGGWTGGSPTQFEPQCQYLASRGMVAMTADYRVRSRHGVKVPQCIEDAKSAVRWVRRNADRLGIDPERVAAGGGSAGGHLAAATGLIAGFDAPGEDKSISAVPDAMVLFNPAAALAPFDGARPMTDERLARLKDRVGDDPKSVSPAHHVGPGAPPAIMFFGTDDFLLDGARWMQKRMKEEGNRCELLTWEGLAHGFFNKGRHGDKPFVETMQATDKFLASLGWLEGEPTIK